MASQHEDPWPTEIRLHKDRTALTVAFDTGETFALPAEYLRVNAGPTYIGDNAKARRELGYNPRPLKEGLAVGQLILVSGAVRDEGVSYHYLPPAREAIANETGVRALTTILRRHGLPYREGKTWTTDAPYRETPTKIAQRRAEGCLTVEMESAGLMAVAQFRGVTFGQVLYGGDDLSGVAWDNRAWRSQAEVRESLFWLCAEACLLL